MSDNSEEAVIMRMEARVEERFKKQLRDANLEVGNQMAIRDEARQERDAARAQVARLRDALKAADGSHVHAYDCSSLDSSGARCDCNINKAQEALVKAALAETSDVKDPTEPLRAQVARLREALVWADKCFSTAIEAGLLYDIDETRENRAPIVAALAETESNAAWLEGVKANARLEGAAGVMVTEAKTGGFDRWWSPSQLAEHDARVRASVIAEVIAVMDTSDDFTMAPRLRRWLTSRSA